MLFFLVKVRHLTLRQGGILSLFVFISTSTYKEQNERNCNFIYHFSIFQGFALINLKEIIRLLLFLKKSILQISTHMDDMFLHYTIQLKKIRLAGKSRQPDFVWYISASLFDNEVFHFPGSGFGCSRCIFESYTNFLVGISTQRKISTIVEIPGRSICKVGWNLCPGSSRWQS